VQACADDPQVAFHTVRNLARIGRGVVAMRWSQLGFGRTSSTSSAQATPRNLFGFMDGTNNLKLEDRTLLDEQLWVGAGDGPDWLQGGTYMVTRRIRMLIEVWDRSSLGDQEQSIGRAKLSGAPLGGRREHDPIQLDATDTDGAPVIPATAHVRLAHPDTNAGMRLLRRGYSFTDGMDAATGQLDAGLFFIAFQRDPQQFVAIQQRLAATDGLNEYIKHTGSALFVIPPGVERGGFVGEALFN
jgi:deferrochelatase/peroxidase EfeB